MVTISRVSSFSINSTVASSEQKQQQTESVLTKKLEELNAARVSAADSTIVSSTTLPAKRKLDDAAPSKGARTPKRLATALLVSTKLHECMGSLWFSFGSLSVGCFFYLEPHSHLRMLYHVLPSTVTRAPASLTTSPDWEHAALFRIAVRYYLQTHQVQFIQTNCWYWLEIAHVLQLTTNSGSVCLRESSGSRLSSWLTSSKRTLEAPPSLQRQLLSIRRSHCYLNFPGKPLGTRLAPTVLLRPMATRGHGVLAARASQSQRFAPANMVRCVMHMGVWL